MSAEQLLHHVGVSGADSAPLVAAICVKMNEYLQREADGELEQLAWKERETALKYDLEIARRERDKMCRWAFDAAIDQLNKGLAVLALPEGPKSAREFDHNWAWLDFATDEMRSLQSKLVAAFGNAEFEAKRAIRAGLLEQFKLIEQPEMVLREPVEKRARSDGKRIGTQMRAALDILRATPLNADELVTRLAMNADRATARKMPEKLLKDGLVTEGADQKLRPVNLSN